MSNKYVHTDSSEDPAFHTDNEWDFECRQAFIRKKFAHPDLDTEWEKFHSCVNPVSIETKSDSVSKKNGSRHVFWRALAGIAAILVFLAIWKGYDVYQGQRSVMIFVTEQRNQNILIESDNGNQQILSTRKQTDLRSGAIFDQNKADFSAIQEGAAQSKTIKTPYGKDYHVVLNDGTEVIMNADSKLTFPTRFTGSERIVTLEGEAYFKVAKNPQKPFIVRTAQMDTKAVGTEFNVRAYKGSQAHVTLIEGVVEVTTSEAKQNIRMSPNEDATITNNKLHLKEIDPEYYIQWKEGFFYYDNVALGEILSDIGRWYNVNIEIQKQSLMSYRLHFVLNRDARLDEIVESLNNFSYLNAVKIGNKISIREKKSISKD